MNEVNEVTVTLTANPEQWIKSLRDSFSKSTTVLGELMQNARRSGAERVYFEFDEKFGVLTVKDNGCGISSLETLLSLGKSGWDAELIENEHAFGVGFASALFACQAIFVHSQSGEFYAEVADILAFKPIPVLPVAHWDGVTCISLYRTNFTLAQIQSELTRLAMGFPIPVFLNGSQRDRDHALDSGMDFVSTPIGRLCLKGLDTPDAIPVNDFEVYLQGLPVYHSPGYPYGQSRFHVVHLDPVQFRARLPDRDKLLDEAEVIEQIRATLKTEVFKRLKHLKECLSSHDLVAYYKAIRFWDALPLLNDVPVLPVEVLRVYCDYPNCNDDYLGEYAFIPEHPVTQAEIDGGREVVVYDEDMTDDGAALSLFVWKRQSLVYQDGLDDGHWLYAKLRHLNAELLQIKVVQESHRAKFEGDWVWTEVLFCNSYRIQVGNDGVECQDDALFDGNRVLLPVGERSGLAVTQVSRYLGDYDEFMENAYTNDLEAFTQFVIANTVSDPCQALKRLLPAFKGCPPLYGKGFIVHLGDNGDVASVTLATV